MADLSSNCKWRLADAERGLGPWARNILEHSPLEWSDPLCLETACKELETMLLKLPDRPISILHPADAPETETEMHPDPASALKFVNGCIARKKAQSTVSEAEVLRRDANFRRAETFKSRYDPSKPITCYIFKGGGTKGVVYAGAIQRFEQQVGRGDVVKFAGSSAGSQTAALCASGYTGEEFADLAKLQHWDKLVNHSRWYEGGVLKDMVHFNKDFGFSDGNYLEDCLDLLIARKCNGKRQITFEEHYKIHKKELVMGVVDLNRRRFEYLSRSTTPDMPVSKAARASSSIPLVFMPVKWKHKEDGRESLYVDGGMAANLPLDAFEMNPEKERMVAFNLNAGDATHHESPKNVVDFIKAAMLTLKDESQTQYGIDERARASAYEDKGIHLVQIDTHGFTALDIHMKDNDLNTLIKAGYDAAEVYFTGGKQPSSHTVYLGGKYVDLEGSWSAEQAWNLGSTPKPGWDVEIEKLWDCELKWPSVTTAVDGLNSGTLRVEKGLCGVLSANKGTYWLLWRSDKEAMAKQLKDQFCGK